MKLTPENATAAPAATAADEMPRFDHERLDVFRVALEFAGLVPELTRASRVSLRDQLERAAASICLNIAEGCGRRTRRDRLHFFAIAQGSAMECAAAIDVLRVTGGIKLAEGVRAKHKVARVVQMLVGLRRG